MKLTQEIIREHFTYDPIKGILTRKDKLNSVPLCLPYVYFKGGTYSTARIIYQYMIYDEPPKLVMRLDRDPANNKWSNFTTTTEHGILKVRKKSSAQKRPVELSASEMEEIFRYAPDTKELWFLLSANPTLAKKHTLKFKWRGITYIRTRAHVIMRMKYIAGAKRSKEQGFRLVSEKSEASRAKRHETQRIKALRKNDVEPV